MLLSYWSTPLDNIITMLYGLFQVANYNNTRCVYLLQLTNQFPVASLVRNKAHWSTHESKKGKKAAFDHTLLPRLSSQNSQFISIRTLSKQ